MFIGMSGCLLPSLFAALAAACYRKRALTGAQEPLLEGAEAESDAPAGAEEPPPADERLPVRGLKGLLVVGAPTVRSPGSSCPLTLGDATSRPRSWRTCWPRRCPTSGCFTSPCRCTRCYAGR